MRSLFREGRGINSSVAVYQDVTGKAEERVIAMGIAIGSGYLYKTTFEKEVFSDLYGGKKVPKSSLPTRAVVSLVRHVKGSDCSSLLLFVLFSTLLKCVL